MQGLEGMFVSMKRLWFIISFISLAVITMIILALIPDVLQVKVQEREPRVYTIWLLIVALVLAPLIETLLFQKLLIDFFRYKLKGDWPLILISALLFGVGHFFNEYFFRDIIYAFGTGVVFAYAYILAKKRRDMNAFIAVYFIHAGYNLFIILLDWISG